MRYKEIGVYKITNPEGGVYIGQSVNLRARLLAHKAVSRNKKYTPKLCESFEKYGYEAHTFEIVELCPKDRLNELERHYQELYNSCEGINLNCVLTATEHKKGVGVKQTEERKKEVGNFHRGKVYSDETKAKIKEARKRQIITEEHKSKISENSGSARIVLNTDTGIFYKSAKEAAIAYNMKPNTLIGNLIGRNNKKINFVYV
jgi:group I intron endonuclease